MVKDRKRRNVFGKYDKIQIDILLLILCIHLFSKSFDIELCTMCVLEELAPFSIIFLPNT